MGTYFSKKLGFLKKILHKTQITIGRNPGKPFTNLVKGVDFFEDSLALLRSPRPLARSLLMDYWHTPHAPNVQVVLEGDLGSSNVLKFTVNAASRGSTVFSVFCARHVRSRENQESGERNRLERRPLWTCRVHRRHSSISCL